MQWRRRRRGKHFCTLWYDWFGMREVNWETRTLSWARICNMWIHIWLRTCFKNSWVPRWKNRDLPRPGSEEEPILFGLTYPRSVRWMVRRTLSIQFCLLVRAGRLKEGWVGQDLLHWKHPFIAIWINPNAVILFNPHMATDLVFWYAIKIYFMTHWLGCSHGDLLLQPFSGPLIDGGNGVIREKLRQIYNNICQTNAKFVLTILAPPKFDT